MALTDIGGEQFWGPIPAGFGGGSNAFTFSVITADAVNEGLAGIMEAPKPGTIDAISVPVNTVNGNPAAFNVALVTRDAAGDPTATPVSGAVGTYDFTATGAHVIDLSTAGATDLVVTRGQILCPRIWAPAAGVDGANNVVIRSRAAMSRANSGFPYVMEFAAAAWVRQVALPLICVRYSDGMWWPLSPPTAAGPISAAFGNTVEVGGVFTSPLTVRCVGFGMFIDPTATTDTGEVKLYDAANTVLTSVTLTADLWQGSNGQFITRHFPAAVPITAGLTYRLTHLATNASNRQIAEWAVPAAVDRNCPMFQHGLSWARTTRTAAGAWTDLNTTMPVAALLIDQIDQNVTQITKRTVILD